MEARQRVPFAAFLTLHVVLWWAIPSTWLWCLLAVRDPDRRARYLGWLLLGVPLVFAHWLLLEDECVLSYLEKRSLDPPPGRPRGRPARSTYTAGRCTQIHSPIHEFLPFHALRLSLWSVMTSLVLITLLTDVPAWSVRQRLAYLAISGGLYLWSQARSRARPAVDGCQHLGRAMEVTTRGGA